MVDKDMEATVPQPTTDLLYVLIPDDMLVEFDQDSPYSIRNDLSDESTLPAFDVHDDKCGVESRN